MSFLLFSIQAFLGAALLFYVLFAGADFGAGILELFYSKNRRGDQRRLTFHAITPVWEANHVWLIIAVVILFVAFPTVYTLVSTYLYIPLIAILLGIVARGSAFTFRHYDTLTKKYYALYSRIFTLASVWSSFFLGIAAGAWALGQINPSATNFYDLYLACWLNPFCFAMGAFTCVLFALLASVYMIGETSDDELKKILRKRAAAFNVAVVLVGALVFYLAELQGTPLLHSLLNQPLGVVCFALATILLIIFWCNLILHGNPKVQRFSAAAIVAFILLSWYAIQIPAIIRIRQDVVPLVITFQEAAAPDATLRALLMALGIGFVVIFPALFYLLKIFKRETFI